MDLEKTKSQHPGKINLNVAIYIWAFRETIPPVTDQELGARQS